MGEQDVAAPRDEDEARAFMREILDDLRVLERMLEDGALFEGVRRRIGAEQEMFLVNAQLRPAPVALEVLRRASDERLTTELGLFNLEANATPRELNGACLSAMERELAELVSKADAAARESGARVVLAGILPTVRRSDLTLANLTPTPRYRALNDALVAHRRDDFHIVIRGLDEVDLTHDNVMFEACNTSFQVHFQLAPRELAEVYNVAQLVTAPVLAAAASSPLFLGARLWHETRVALFASAIDERGAAREARELKSRVTFGDSWVRESVLEIFEEQVARFRVVLATKTHEDSQAALAGGHAPELRALRLHNGTVYRWNRAVYGTESGRAHLRIENRALPAGPTILDEVANAALFFGLLLGVRAEIGDPQHKMELDVAKKNFYAAARHGLEAQLTWIDGRTLAATELIEQRLLPLAREGLASAGVDEGEIDRYLGVIAARVGAKRTGASWALESFARMRRDAPVELCEQRLVAAMLEHQDAGRPVSEWPLAALDAVSDDESWRQALQRVAQFMSTDLFTVRAGDLVDLAASVMEWRHIKNVPVEDGEGHLVGLVTHRELLRLVARGQHGRSSPVAVREIMNAHPPSVHPDTSILDAIRVMREAGVGCVPVVENEKLVGIVTESDVARIAAKLLERLREE